MRTHTAPDVRRHHKPLRLLTFPQCFGPSDTHREEFLDTDVTESKNQGEADVGGPLPREYLNAETPRRGDAKDIDNGPGGPNPTLRLGASALEEPSHDRNT